MSMRCFPFVFGGVGGKFRPCWFTVRITVFVFSSSVSFPISFPGRRDGLGLAACYECSVGYEDGVGDEDGDEDDEDTLDECLSYARNRIRAVGVQ